MDKIAYIILLYISLPLLIAGYTVMKNDELSKKVFFSEFLLAFIAILLMPLILNSIGNGILTDFFSKEINKALELIAYACAIALAGKKVISTALEALNLSQVKKGLEEHQREIDDLEEEQETIRKKQISVDLEKVLPQKVDSYKELLNSIYNNENTIEVTESNLQMLSELESKRYINVYGKLEAGNPLSCVVTRLGKSFLQEKR